MRVKRSVVQTEAGNSVALDREVTGSVVGTGFVLDAERGIVATNRHVVGTSPALLRVTFHDGESTTARLLHYDAWHDFALIELERDADARWTASAAELGDSFALRDQQELFLVGSNEGQEQSVKFGRVTNLAVNKGWRHSAAIQTSFDRTGGSSGSPVFDAGGRVVALHTAGTNTTSFELRIEYVRDALRQLLESGRVRRGEVGLELDLIPVAEARRATRLPDGIAERIAAASGERKQAIQVRVLLRIMTHLLPKLQCQCAEFLNQGSLKHLGIFSPPTCVGLRYGHLIDLLGAFLGSMGSVTYFRLRGNVITSRCL